MPYITDERKEELKNVKVLFHKIAGELKLTKGDLNYLICELIVAHLLSRYKLGYQNISEAIDAVHGAEDELRRRLLYPYEDMKIYQNGDIFGRVLNKFDKISLRGGEKVRRNNGKK